MYKQFLKTLRKNMTQPEKILWHFLKNRRFFNYKFRRQVLIDNYIVDFICYEKNLVIELDSRQHYSLEQISYDEKRTEFLNKAGFHVVRYCNTDVLNNIESVLEHLKSELETAPLSALQTHYPVEGDGYDKTSLRTWAKSERSKLDMKAVSKKLVQKLKDTEEYKTSKNIMIFYPLENEVNLLELLDDSSKCFYLPKIEGQELLCCPYTKGDELCISCFKTQEPISKPVDKNLLDLVIVPALAVDKNHHRLGYGGGFYDRFLSSAKCQKIICIPNRFVLATVYPQPHDVAVDKCITCKI